MLQFATTDAYLGFFASWSPHAPAFVTGDQIITYEEAERQVAACAAALQIADIATGDVVAAYGHSRSECFVVFLACMRIGAVFIGLNPKYASRELTRALTDSAPAVLFGVGQGEESTKLLAAVGASSYNGEVVALDRLSAILSGEPDRFRRSTSGRPIVDGGGRPAVIVYTSGTTGRPKAAMLSESGLCLSAELTAQTWLGGLVPRMISDKPINHLGWLVCVCLATMVRGGTLYFEERFDPRRTLELIEHGRVNAWLTSSVLLSRVAALPEFDAADLSSLKQLGISSSVSIDLLDRFTAKSAARVSNSYGLTEASGGVVTASRADASINEATTTVGIPVPGVEFMIADDSGSPVAVGFPGEIWVRGPLVFLGYRGQPDETAAAVDAQGWLHTGDTAMALADGNVRLVGRLKEMFKSGGLNVYPAEVEALMMEHPAVAQVVVVGVPDTLWHEVGVAFVVPDSESEWDEDDLRAFCRAELANHKVPKRFVVCESLPFLPSGKVDRLALRADGVRTSPAEPLPSVDGDGSGGSVGHV